ncbi:MAG: hypothetical protein V7L20_08735 [Nostoc sp.]|uniref:hypothetical protein n=1 Tax=Nostoc sp. TaxID=1180 RepID=UPI002FFB6E43
MKKLIPLSVLGFAAALSLTTLPFASAESKSNLIIPGQSIGQTHLGLNGGINLGKPPDAGDFAMMKGDSVWVSKQGNKKNTLYIHYLKNAALNVQPIDGITIETIRITSSWFHTDSNISTENTKAQILRRFPKASSNEKGTLFVDEKLGIAFEFAQSTDNSPCIAISVFSPSRPYVTTKERVQYLLDNNCNNKSC